MSADVRSRLRDLGFEVWGLEPGFEVGIGESVCYLSGFIRRPCWVDRGPRLVAVSLKP